MRKVGDGEKKNGKKEKNAENSGHYLKYLFATEVIKLACTNDLKNIQSAILD